MAGPILRVGHVYGQQVEELRLRLHPAVSDPWTLDALELLGRMVRAVVELERRLSKERAEQDEVRSELLLLVDRLESGHYAEALELAHEHLDLVKILPDELEWLDDLVDAWRRRGRKSSELEPVTL